MDRTLKNAIHKAWEAAHKQGKAFEPNALACFAADEDEVNQAVKHEALATENQHRAHVSPQVPSRTDALTTIEKAPESPSAARIEKTLPLSLFEP